MAGNMSVLGLILSSSPYLRSAKVRFFFKISPHYIAVSFVRIMQYSNGFKFRMFSQMFYFCLMFSLAWRCFKQKKMSELNSKELKIYNIVAMTAPATLSLSINSNIKLLLFYFYFSYLVIMFCYKLFYVFTLILQPL